jgi:hypothetical protein
MSTVQRVNFEPVRDVLPIQRGEFPLVDQTLADPYNAVCLVDGEWMVLDPLISGKMVRASNIAVVSNLCTTHPYPLWAERGRTDVLGKAERSMPILWLGSWEFDTRIFDATVVAVGGAAITAIDQAVCVATITLGTRNYTGLVGWLTGCLGTVVGRVTRLPANNGGKLRIRGGMLY